MTYPACLAVLAALALAAGCGGGNDSVAVPWLRVEPISGGHILRVGYESDPCTRARRALVEEGRHAVTVTLLDPERDPERVCIAIVRPGCVSVRLERPLAGRRLVDGARDRFRRRGADRRPFGRFGVCRPVAVRR
jgi:hypothetical protein